MSEHTGYPGAPPGWYPDPAGGPGQRWWDGYAWTEATVLPDRPPPPPTWSAAPPPVGPPVQVAPWAVATERLTTHTTGGLVDSELRMERIARVAVAVPAACAIVNVVVDRLNSDRWLAFGHQFRVIWHDAQNHVTPPPYHGPSGYSPVNLLAGLVALAAAVVALVWQHRAASAARSSASPPSNRRPGAWGPGSCPS